MTENVWDNRAIEKLGGEYNKLYNSGENDDFSWVLDEDKEVLNLNKMKVVGDKKEQKEISEFNTDTVTIKKGLPSQVHGNPEEASLFLCLFNPRVQDSKSIKKSKKNINVKTYVNIENNNDDEYFKNNDGYYSHIIDNQNILAKEFKYLKDHPKTNINKLYYLSHYYYFLFETDGAKGSKAKRIKDIIDDTFSKNDFNIDKLRICNLELFAYRTETRPKYKKYLFKSGKSYRDLKSSQYVANLIIDRVKDKTKDKPVFIFRAYDEWSRVIKQELGIRMEIISRDEKLSGKNSKKVNKEYNSLFKDCFYKFASRGGSITKNNVKAISTGKKIENSGYKKIQSSILENKKEEETKQTSEKNSQNGK
ncbi:hypothetical protein C5L30_000166 [Companilactobacillus farciminis]|uniref:Uncharacterized protein n=1 Tax=Companilactobacillus farciminis TaxID=1612 RepID=A0A4R5NDH4_9LACO|nr:hypothetical protein [Companilactobacillus farciminis]ATO45620.1 hypothetical protein LF20184_02085 [Companilactobacillus farciminis KCTC 3681 = DSM 20184]KRK61918.1 hypothetical protein FC68_GL000449 [Companilactobacillus farciminis KCTC 3681 = DSM 20184]TDG71517.1 hypothetical protein C5L30_000166 [Companilactobacillus farciminis]HJF86725.1 hypothetical protein [Companilactobacillus farciminis]